MLKLFRIILNQKKISNSGAAGLIESLFMESELILTNLQNSYESKLKMNNTLYTVAINNNFYINFTYDFMKYNLA